MKTYLYCAKIAAPYSETLFKSFIPEEKKTERFEYKVKKAKKEIIFEVCAKDATALRGALNSVTKLISVHEKVESLQ